MFTADDIQRRVKTQPFRPLRIVTSSGQAYDITHPDLVMVGRRAVIVGTPGTENPSTFEVDNYVALMHITDLQDLPAARTSGGNGEG